MSKFRRSRENKVLFGVFSGLEKFFKTKGYDIDRYNMRVIYIFLVIFTPVTISWCLFIAYFIVSLFLPYEGEWLIWNLEELKKIQ